MWEKKELLILKKYRCIKSFDIEIYDEHGASTGTFKTIKLGSEWYVDEDIQYNMIAGAEALHLIEITNQSNKLNWIEVYEDTLQIHFEKVEAQASDYWFMYDQKEPLTIPEEQGETEWLKDDMSNL